MLLPPRPRGRPRKTERPQRLPQRDHPINHHVTDRPHGRIADRDKPGRPRAPPPRPRPRPRTPDPTPSSKDDNTARLTPGLDTDKQQHASDSPCDHRGADSHARLATPVSWSRPPPARTFVRGSAGGRSRLDDGVAAAVGERDAGGGGRAVTALVG